MSDVIAEFVAQLTFKADTRELTEAEKKAKEAAQKSAEAWQKLGGVISSVGKVALGAAGGLLALVERSAASAAAIDDMAQRAGIGTRELQRLSFAATKAGAGPEQLADAFKTLDRQITEARKGAGPAAEAFRALGISATSLVDLNAEQRFGVLADKLAGLTDPALKTKIALDLLGGSGDKLLPALNGGAAGLKAAGDEAERLGLVLSDNAIKAAADFDDQLEAVKLQGLAVARDIGIQLIPAVQSVIKHWDEWGKVLIAFGLALGGLKIGAAANSLTQLGFAAAGAKLGVAGLVVTVGALAFSLGTATDNALGLSDAIAGVNQVAGGRTAVPLNELSAEEQAQLAAAVARRDKGNELATSGVRSDFAELGARDAAAAQREIDAIQSRAASRLAGQEALRQTTIKAGAGAQRANSETAIAAANKQTAAAQKKAQEAFAKKRKGGGGKKTFQEDISAGQIEFDDTHGDELRRLAERHGIGETAVDAALKAGAESLAGGATEFVARNAALSRLGSAAGVDLTTKRQTDPLLSQIFGDENVPDVALSSIARGAEPQVLISNITNTFAFDIDQHIEGSGDPAVAADLSGRSIRDFFQGSIAQATKTARVNFAR